ncbi:MAG: hypothetical protein ACWA5Q_01395, partial [bacterium]
MFASNFDADQYDRINQSGAFNVLSRLELWAIIDHELNARVASRREDLDTPDLQLDMFWVDTARFSISFSELRPV